MKAKPILFNIVLLTAFLISACGGATAPTADTMIKKEAQTAEAMMDKTKPTADAMMPHETPTTDAMMTKGIPTLDAMMEAPAWYSAPLTEASTGQAFNINDFKGKVVLVEAMAIWCPTCLKQQGQIKALYGLIGERDDFVTISLDIDPNEDTNSLKSYVEKNGFSWLYSVSTANVSSDLSSLYGDQFLNPPSTPIVVVDRHGEAHLMPFGLKSADDLMKFIKPFLDDGM